MYYVRIAAGTAITNAFSGERGRLEAEVCMEMNTSPTPMQARIDAAQTMRTHPEMVTTITQAEYEAWVSSRTGPQE